MTYKPKNNIAVLNHWPTLAWVLNDKDDNDKDEQPIDKAILDAQIASQDYFALLATRLDQIANSIDKNNTGGYALLEHSIKELLYLHQTHSIQKKLVA